jgi:hypothetical protein
MSYLQQCGRVNRTKECWINVYYYKSTRNRYHSHCINTKEKAEYFAKNKRPKCKTLYRIHVRLK